MISSQIIALISCIVGVLSLIGVGYVIQHMWKIKIDQKESKDRKIRTQEQYEQDKHIEEIVNKSIVNALAPITTDIKSVRESLEKMQGALSENSEGTVTLLRDRMQCSLEYCKKKGYVTEDELFNWKQMFSRYTEMGGNFFHEKVGIWKKEMESLPIKDKQGGAN